MKIALIFGSSGLVGSQLLKTIIKKNNYDKIKLFVRSVIDNSNSKVEFIKTDFVNLEKHKDLITGNDCFFALVLPIEIHLIKMNIEELNTVFL